MYQNPQSMFNPYSQNIAIIKGYLKKPIILATAIISTIVATLTFVTSIFATPYMVRLAEFMSEVLEEPIVYSPNPSSAIISAIVPAMVAIAFFIIYSKSKKEDPYSNPSDGVSILSIISLIQMILIILSVMGIVGVTSLLFFTTLGAMSPEIIALYIAVGTTITLSLVFYISQYKFYSNIKRGLTSVVLSTKGAGTFGVANILYSVLGFLSGIIMLMPVFMNDTVIEYPQTNASLDLNDIMPLFLMQMIISMLSAVQCTLIAKIALGYKKYINQVANSYNSVQPPFAAQYVQPPLYQQQPFVTQQAVNTENYPMPLKEEPNPLELSSNDKITAEDYRPNDDIIVCPFCKKRLSKEVIFCDSCGNKVQ